MTAREEKSSIILYALILFLVSIIPDLGQFYTTHSAGNAEIIGPELGFFLALGIYLRWKYIDKLFYFIITAALVADFILFFNSRFSINFILLSVCHLALLIIFIFSKYIQHYIKSGYRYTKLN